jgi:hypothetical protein
MRKIMLISAFSSLTRKRNVSLVATSIPQPVRGMSWPDAKGSELKERLGPSGAAASTCFLSLV